MTVELGEAEEFMSFEESEEKLFIEDLSASEVQAGNFLLQITLDDSLNSEMFEIRVSI